MANIKLVEEILYAKTNKDIFPSSDPDSVSSTYKKYARNTHPDLYSHPDEKTKANDAFLILNRFRDEILGKVKTMNINTVSAPIHTYELVEEYPADSVFSYFKATYENGSKTCQLLVTNDPDDNDLGTNYAEKLLRLHNEVEGQYRVFYPELIEKFSLAQKGKKHFGITYKVPEGFYSLTEIKNAYPQGLNGRNVAWIFKRMLVTVGNAHDCGLVHGGLSDEAFIIHAEKHGLKLRNWQYSVNEGEKLKAIEPEMEDFYPDEILVEKKPATWKHDIHMLSHIVENMLDPETTPEAYYTFLKGCRISSIPSAAGLLGEFNDLLRRIYGEPKFSVLEMPPVK